MNMQTSEHILEVLANFINIALIKETSAIKMQALSRIQFSYLFCQSINIMLLPLDIHMPRLYCNLSTIII